MRLLVLGGTADARCIADALHGENIDIIYSVAGLVRVPSVACEVVSGGFRQFGGLERYLKANSIHAIVDATHPYTMTMSNTAIRAAQAVGIACWRFQRPPWQQQAKDNWFYFNDWDELVYQLYPYSTRFVSVGQLNQSELELLAEKKSCQLVYRTAVKPTVQLPENTHWLKAIGPFSIDDELRLMRDYKVDVVISKNSGGNATIAKIEAAKILSIPVFMLSRPLLNKPDIELSCPEKMVEYVIGWNQKNIKVQKH